MNLIIEKYVDNGVEWLRQKNMLLRPIANLPTEMCDNEVIQKSDWKPWKPVDSLVTDQDILDIENDS